MALLLARFSLELLLNRECLEELFSHSTPNSGRWAHILNIHQTLIERQKKILFMDARFWFRYVLRPGACSSLLMMRWVFLRQVLVCQVPSRHVTRFPGRGNSPSITRGYARSGFMCGPSGTTALALDSDKSTFVAS